MVTKAGYGSTEEQDIDLAALSAVKFLQLEAETLPDLSEELIKVMEESAGIF